MLKGSGCNGSGPLYTYTCFLNTFRRTRVSEPSLPQRPVGLCPHCWSAIQGKSCLHSLSREICRAGLKRNVLVLDQTHVPFLSRESPGLTLTVKALHSWLLLQSGATGPSRHPTRLGDPGLEPRCTARPAPVLGSTEPEISPPLQGETLRPGSSLPHTGFLLIPGWPSED